MNIFLFTLAIVAFSHGRKSEIPLCEFDNFAEIAEAPTYLNTSCTENEIYSHDPPVHPLSREEEGDKYPQMREENSKNDLAYRTTIAINGGEDAMDGQLSWMVAIYRRNRYKCSGFIISRTTVISAAHCFFNQNRLEDASIYSGIVGSVDRTNGITLTFKEIYPHPKYKIKKIHVKAMDEYQSTTANNLVLLKTSRPIPLGSQVGRICIANNNIGSKNLPATAMGWGSSHPDGKGYSRTLKYTVLKTFPGRFCRRNAKEFSRRKICAVRRHSGICFGDSGGPLVMDQDGIPVAIGVTAGLMSDKDCTELSRQGEFVKLSYYKNFIRRHDRHVCLKNVY